jgi:hypothetical protein
LAGRTQEVTVSDSDFRPSDPDEVPPTSDETTPAVDAPEADAAEQRRPVRDDDDDIPNSIPYDVDPADAAEQHRVVDFDEDDYR